MKKKMYTKLIGLVGVCMMALLGFTACSPDSTGNVDQSEPHSIFGEQYSQEQQENQEQEGQTDFAGADLYAGANLQGSVVEFSNDGFKMAAAKVVKEEEGDIMIQAAPGSENEEELVTITYGSNITFEEITIDSASLTELSRETTDKQSIKKETSVLIFGSCQDTYHWTADKVIIMRWK